VPGGTGDAAGGRPAHLARGVGRFVTHRLTARPPARALGRGGILVLVLVAMACARPVPAGLFDALPGPVASPHVALHYLGSGGWLIQRGTDRIATAPFVSNPSGFTVLFPGGPDRDLIDDDAVIPPMPDVRIILVGHGHYDHAMDLPYVHRKKAPNADIYGGTTVVNTLWAAPGLAPYLKEIAPADAASGDRPGRWFPSERASVRFMPLRSTHAPHFAGRKIVPWWSVDERQTALPCCPYWWKEGETYAYIIDFLDGQGRVEFRIYYQDTAARPGTGVAPVFEGADAARVDVAILCVAAFHQVDGNPEHILTNLQPRHVIGGHWEDFIFRSYRGRPVRPVPGTSMEEFHRRARALSPGRAIYLPEPGQTVFIPIAPRP
jgi:L-ascorbate metabolism protein UlaG (beta-lactamase superfamily)